MSLLPEPSLLAEEFAEEFAALVGQYAIADFAAVVQSRVVEQLKERPGGPGFGVGRTVNHEGDTCLKNGPGTHWAWLKRDIQRAFFEPPTAERFGGLRNGDHFGVRGRVLQLFPLIVRGGNDLVVMHDHRTDGNLRFFKSGQSFNERHLHVTLMPG